MQLGVITKNWGAKLQGWVHELHEFSRIGGVGNWVHELVHELIHELHEFTRIFLLHEFREFREFHESKISGTNRRPVVLVGALHFHVNQVDGFGGGDGTFFSVYV